MSEKPTYEELEQRVRELESAESDRKREEEALLEFEERYNLLIQHSLTGIYIHIGGLLKFVNKRFAAMMGYVPEEMVGRQYWEFVHPGDKEMVKSISLARSRGEEAPTEYEFRHLSKTGETVWVQNLPTIIQYEGQIANMGNLIQINDRKKAERELKRSELFLNTTGKMAKVGGWELAADTLELSWTDETYRIHEVPISYKPPIDKAINFFHPDDRPKLESAIKRALDNGEPYDMETRFITAKGKPLWTHTICKPVVEGGKTVKLIGTFQDITERKQSEKKLTESEERFRNLAENSIVGVNIIQDGILKYVNLKFAEIFGYSVEECLDHMPYQRLVHPEDLETVQDNILKRLSREAESLHYTFRGVKKSGETVHLEIFGSSIQFEGKAATFATILDITERVNVEQEREKLISDLKSALKEIKQLSGLLPICAHCKKIRNETGYWDQVESYIHEHSEAQFSHGICPECAEKYYPDMDIYGEDAN
jgi:PAS domain S-box-containing protein